MPAAAWIACSLLTAAPLHAQTVADFYKGKQITFVVSTEAGQDYDIWARLVARHMRQYVPGAPAFVVQNMPGAGSLIAANYLYNKAPQDGTVIGMVSRNIPNYALMHQPNANYDPQKFNWLGSPEITHRGCYARSDAGIRTPEDLFVRELVVGGDGAGTALTETPLLLKNLLGMKFKLIDGYKGATGVIRLCLRQDRRAAEDPRCACLEPRARSADARAAQCPARAGRCAPPRFRCHHGGCGALGRGKADEADRRGALRRGDRGGDRQGRGAACGVCRQGGADDADSTIVS
jgi:hypothetical protein